MLDLLKKPLLIAIAKIDSFSLMLDDNIILKLHIF